MTDEIRPFDGVTIVIADDSQTIRHVVVALLGAAGCRVVTAEDGFDVLAKIVDEKPDLVFLDINMPRLDGYQACVLIKQNDAYCETSVVLLSAKNSVFDRARSRVVKADDYLVKPFSRDELLDIVRRHVSAVS
ncbi:MAG: response regulator [Gammaproteobacteria bacterium]|nr:response regulator [Gammaproteobacteria bacterium]